MTKQFDHTAKLCHDHVTADTSMITGFSLYLSIRRIRNEQNPQRQGNFQLLNKGQ